MVRPGQCRRRPVSGDDWNGDRRSGLGVFDPASATFSLRMVAADGTAWYATAPFGRPRDLPVTGDWDGAGTNEVGTWTPSSAVFSLRAIPGGTGTAGTAVRTVRFEAPR